MIANKWCLKNICKFSEVMMRGCEMKNDKKNNFVCVLLSIGMVTLMTTASASGDPFSLTNLESQLSSKEQLLKQQKMQLQNERSKLLAIKNKITAKLNSYNNQIQSCQKSRLTACQKANIQDIRLLKIFGSNQELSNCVKKTPNECTTLITSLKNKFKAYEQGTLQNANFTIGGNIYLLQQNIPKLEKDIQLLRTLIMNQDP
ncbi:MAG: hypothetical protein A3F17_03185 [Gammaproteobacteria bacterium RIFCSPHIGHO2_12_FULL_41_15]|nr:MAG: hypothetical protein A3F17_03185 [Gammaproteobacteria bacterium RIFCSPHIGHO2_12_FULL_41_15]